MSGELSVVSTPIGNLGDVTTRAAEVLAGADRILCEDTRRTRILLSALGIPGRGRLVSLHEHNEEGRISSVVGRRWPWSVTPARRGSPTPGSA